MNPKKTESTYLNSGTLETDIKMEFGSDKCPTLNIRRGKLELEGFETWQGDIIGPVNETDTRTYKYIGKLQSRQFQHTKYNKQVTPATTSRLQEVRKTRVNSKKKNLGRQLIHTLFPH